MTKYEDPKLASALKISTLGIFNPGLQSASTLFFGVETMEHSELR